MMPLTKRRLLAIGGVQAATSSEVVVAEIVVNWGHGHLLQETSWWESLLCGRATTDTRATREGKGAPTRCPFGRNERQSFSIFGVQVSVSISMEEGGTWRFNSSLQQQKDWRGERVAAFCPEAMAVPRTSNGLGFLGWCYSRFASLVLSTYLPQRKYCWCKPLCLNSVKLLPRWCNLIWQDSGWQLELLISWYS